MSIKNHYRAFRRKFEYMSRRSLIDYASRNLGYHAHLFDPFTREQLMNFVLKKSFGSYLKEVGYRG